MIHKQTRPDFKVYVIRNHNPVCSHMGKCRILLVFLIIFPINHDVQALHYDNQPSLNSQHFVKETSARFIEEEQINVSTDSYEDILENDTNLELKNVKMEPVYITERNKIVLNITWDKLTDSSNLGSYHFKVAPFSKSSKCTTDTSYTTTIYNKTLTQILLPPVLNSHEIHPDCTYKIYMTLESLLGTRNTTEFNYTTPVCVGRKCSCNNLSPKCISLNAAEILPGRLNVSWSTACSYEQNRTIYNITNLTLEYRPNVSERAHNLFHEISLFSNFELKQNYVILKETYEHFIPKKLYQLRATFTNAYNCKISNATYFTVARAKSVELKNEKQSTNSPWLQIVLAIILISFIMLTVIYLVRRNRLILKEILLNPFPIRFMRRGSHGSDLRNSYIMVPPIIKRQQAVNILYTDKEIVEGSVDRFEFPRSKIIFVKEIGSGAFGQVFLAKAYNIDNQPGQTYVAVKVLRERAPPEERDDFLSEIDILKRVGEHPNIVRMFGCCILHEPNLLIMEFVPCGNLKDYLLELREKWKKKRMRNESCTSDGTYIAPDSPIRRTKSERPSITETEYTSLGSEGFPTPTDIYNNKVECTLDHTELQNFALQIAKGMEHLEKIPIAHRDLAARNILINEYKTLKISDFGLSRVGPYVNNRTKKLPLRWVAIEAIEDHFYDSKGDVWSFAVVLWEIGTLGAFPYENILDGLIHAYLASGKRLPIPEVCTDELYSLMLRCWSHDPQQRPSFQELVDLLDVKKRRVYVDFSQLNPLYVFPPAQLEELDNNFKQRNLST